MLDSWALQLFSRTLRAKRDYSYAKQADPRGKPEGRRRATTYEVLTETFDLA
jgi:hypothetical protein